MNNFSLIKIKTIMGGVEERGNGGWLPSFLFITLPKFSKNNLGFFFFFLFLKN